ncbi:MAG: NYN domain-containing protein [Microcoleus sp. SIO2G3]|nr:NYN domain-containing protein [Microcoleus sp. SIO2G3]
MLLQFSTYPVKLKIAFANWRSMGRHDLDFHDRSYQMIHVPNGKNAADIQMTAIGASLFLQYPHAKEVFVCSNDAHLITLCNLLQTQGWKVYALRKWGIRLTLTDWTNSRIKVFSVAESEFDPHIELEQKLAKLLLALTARNPEAFISMGALASQFKKHYDSAVTDVMRSWSLGSNFLKFLQSCEGFKLERTDSDWRVAIRPIAPKITPPFADPPSVDRATPV